MAYQGLNSCKWLCESYEVPQGFSNNFGVNLTCKGVTYREEFCVLVVLVVLVVQQKVDYGIKLKHVNVCISLVSKRTLQLHRSKHTPMPLRHCTALNPLDQQSKRKLG